MFASHLLRERVSSENDKQHHCRADGFIARPWCTAVGVAFVLTVCGFVLVLSGMTLGADRPNVLWITSEDNGPHLGCYGDEYSQTPSLDRLAVRGMRYANASSTAPVCAPARTVIISGMWAPSLGGEHMRSQVQVPRQFKMYPQYLREAGYYCTNNSKTDYNLALQTRLLWDESSRKAHWKNRSSDQPFFSIFNFTISHESQIRNKIQEKNRIHDPAQVRIPAYHPDTPEVRKDWAQYYDRLTMMDAQCGQALAELQEAGLDGDTIVFYYGDHGSGMPRNKRWPYNSGLSVPLIVYVPPKWQHLAPADYQPGGESDRLVSFYDLGPTVLSVCDIDPPENMHGRPFMGQKRHAVAQPEYAFGFRGRMDERYDLVRVVRDKRYIYLRQFMPHKIYGQHISYMFQTPTTRVWKQWYDDGKLNEVQSRFWQTKPSEELYDLQADRDEVHNLADSPGHQAVVQRMRAALMQQLLAWRDLGFLPEGQIHSRAGDDAPWTMAQDETRYPMRKILTMADLASSERADALSGILAGLRDNDSAVRYWAAMGLLFREQAGWEAGHTLLRAALGDEAPEVRVIAAEALGRYGNPSDVQAARELLVEHSDLRMYDTFTVMLALNALQAMGVDKVSPAKDRIAGLPTKVPQMPPRADGYVGRLLATLRADLGLE